MASDVAVAGCNRSVSSNRLFSLKTTKRAQYKSEKRGATKQTKPPPPTFLPLSSPLSPPPQKNQTSTERPTWPKQRDRRRLKFGLVFFFLLLPPFFFFFFLSVFVPYFFLVYLFPLAAVFWGVVSSSVSLSCSIQTRTVVEKSNFCQRKTSNNHTKPSVANESCDHPPTRTRQLSPARRRSPTFKAATVELFLDELRARCAVFGRCCF